MPSAENLTPSDRERLLEIAEHSIRAAVHGRSFSVNLEDEARALREPAATFTTLRSPGGDLRGCTGVVSAIRPLAEDVAATARGAAIHDSRFQPVRPEELDGLDLSLSVLTPMVKLPVRNEDELLATIRPGIDGVMLVDGARRGLFLPSVWQSLPDPGEFIAHLRRKARLPPTGWSPTLEVFHFTVEKIAHQ